jgi:hypothetical protein
MAQKTEQARRGLDAIAGMAREASCKGPPPRVTMTIMITTVVKAARLCRCRMDLESRR